MGTFQSRLKALTASLGKSLLSSPHELSLGLVYYASFLFRKPLETFLEGKGFQVEFPDYLIWFLPQMVLVYCLHRLSRRNRAWGILAVLAWFLWVPVLLWGSAPGGWTVGIAYLVAVLALVLGTGRQDNVSFGRSVHLAGVSFAEDGLVTLLVMGLVSAIIASVNYLFGLKLGRNVYDYNHWFCFLVLLPMLCIGLLEANQEGAVKGKTFLRIMVDWVLSLSLVIYTAILYGYIVRILIQGELPNGGVAYMILAFIGVALVCYLLRLLLEKRHFEWFYKGFPLIALPTLVLLWVGTLRRIREYGFTDARVYLFALAVLATLFVAMLVSERSRRFQRMAVILALCAVALTYVPGIRAKDIGIRSQLARMDKLLPDVLVDGHFPYIANYAELAADSVRSDRVENCHSIWTYLKDQMDSTAFAERLGGYGDFSFKGWELRRAKDALSKTPSVPTVRKWSLSDSGREAVDLGPYTQWVPQFYVMPYNDSCVVIYRFPGTQEELISCPVRDRLNQADDATLPEDVLIFENGRYRAVFSEIVDNGPGKHFGEIERKDIMLFKKPD